MSDVSPLPAREAQVLALRRRLESEFGVAAEQVEVVLAPYRICPLGAHSDHQHGRVLGAAIDACTLLAFAPVPAPGIALSSADFPSSVRVTLGPAPRLEGPAWGRYAQGAAAVLRDRLGAEARGFVGCLAGSLPGAGLSSSASLTIACLLALARCNGLALAPEELARLACRAENEHVGVACGVLDPAAVAGSRRDHLLAIDTAAVRWQAIPLPADARRACFLVAYTGMPRNLASTDFNRRVAECLRAARRLGELAGIPAERLGDLPDAAFEAHAQELPRGERLRAQHFFSERTRVREGVAAWRSGDLHSFGLLMHASCESSMSNYETGSPELRRLQEILRATPGVLGSRFSGAGFGGSAIALVAEEGAESARAQAEADFRAAFPALASRARCFVTRSEDGARVLGS